MKNHDLAQYAVLAGAFLSTAELRAEIIHTNVDPDYVIVDDTLEIDMNADGDIEFIIEQYDTVYTWGPYRENAFIKRGGTGYAMLISKFFNSFSGLFPQKLYYGEPIDEDTLWGGSGFGINFNGVPNSPWNNTYDRYLGVKIEIAGQGHFGWIHLDVSDGLDSVIIRGYAYDDVPGRRVYAGETVYRQADSASELLAQDLSDFGDGRDLVVSFDRAEDEFSVSEYSLITVKESSVSSFDLEAAISIGADRYISVLPNGADHVVQIGAGTLDSDGDPIIEGQPYRVFVLNRPNYSTHFVDVLSAPSNVVVLSSPTSIEEPGIAPKLWSWNNAVYYQDLIPSSRILLYSLSGSYIAEHQANTGSWDLSNLPIPDGIYLLKVERPGGELLLTRRISLQARN